MNEPLMHQQIFVSLWLKQFDETGNLFPHTWLLCVCVREREIEREKWKRRGPGTTNQCIHFIIKHGCSLLLQSQTQTNLHDLYMTQHQLHYSTTPSNQHFHYYSMNNATNIVKREGEMGVFEILDLCLEMQFTDIKVRNSIFILLHSSLSFLKGKATCRETLNFHIFICSSK